MFLGRFHAPFIQFGFLLIIPCIYSLQVTLFAWASIERHILIFHDQWVSTQSRRLFVHYILYNLLFDWLFWNTLCMVKLLFMRILMHSVEGQVNRLSMNVACFFLLEDYTYEMYRERLNNVLLKIIFSFINWYNTCCFLINNPKNTINNQWHNDFQYF